MTAFAKTNSDADDNILCKPNLKILHIGNSFTFDAVSYLPQIIDGTGTDVSDVCIYRTMMAGGSFKTWYDTFNNINTGLDYSIEKVCGGIDANIATGSGKDGDGSLFRKALTDEQWDIIFIQPVSSASPYYEQWAGDGPGGYLNEFLSMIKTNQPQATIGLMLVHSYASSNPNNIEGSSLLRWEKIMESVENCCYDYSIDLVIPYGTAVQNLRASSLNNEQDLTADGVHCEFILTRYVASCCYYQSILAPRSGVSVLEDNTRINKEFVQIDSPMISVDDNTAPIAQKAAVMAVNDWHRCANPETDYDETTTGISTSSTMCGGESGERVYELSGMNAKASDKKGIYIKQGRKFVNSK